MEDLPFNLLHVVELRLAESSFVVHFNDGTRDRYACDDVPAIGSLRNWIRVCHQPEETSQTMDFGFDWCARRWRGHIYHHNDGWSTALRLLPDRVYALPELDLDAGQLMPLAQGSGLMLLVGATGSGKSTTLAAIMHSLALADALGNTVTIEQPIEYIHHDEAVEQREVGVDTVSFASGVIEAMRQMPRTIVIGEIRDPNTADAAVQAGLTGHRVLATLHAKSVADALVRIRALLPAHQRSVLPVTLQGVMAQSLVFLPDRKAIPVYETLQVTDSVSAIVEKGPEALPLLSHEFRHQDRESMMEMRQRLVRERIIPA